MIGRKREPTTSSTKHDPEPFSRLTQLALVPHPNFAPWQRQEKRKRARQEKKKRKNIWDSGSSTVSRDRLLCSVNISGCIDWYPHETRTEIPLAPLLTRSHPPPSSPAPSHSPHSPLRNPKHRKAELMVSWRLAWDQPETIAKTQVHFDAAGSKLGRANGCEMVVVQGPKTPKPGTCGRRGRKQKCYQKERRKEKEALRSLKPIDSIAMAPKKENSQREEAEEVHSLRS